MYGALTVISWSLFEINSQMWNVVAARNKVNMTFASCRPQKEIKKQYTSEHSEKQAREGGFESFPSITQLSATDSQLIIHCPNTETPLPSATAAWH